MFCLLDLSQDITGEVCREGDFCGADVEFWLTYCIFRVAVIDRSYRRQSSARNIDSIWPISSDLIRDLDT
jgi:hypothetical protein